MADENGAREPQGALRELARLSSLGVQFAVTVALCVGAGWWADRELGTSPWLLLLGGLVGAGAAFYHVYRALVGRDDGSVGEED
jgi:F0F1-type ATP synthase assembly protein I